MYIAWNCNSCPGLGCSNCISWLGNARNQSGPALAPGAGGAEVEALRQRFIRFGYGLAPHGPYDLALEDVVAAFQRHWRQARVSGIADAETRALLTHLLDRLSD